MPRPTCVKCGSHVDTDGFCVNIECEEDNRDYYSASEYEDEEDDDTPSPDVPRPDDDDYVDYLNDGPY